MKSYRAISFEQGKLSIVIFCAPVKDIWERFSINRRVADKDEGYQRALSEIRVEKIARYIKAKNAIPLSILVSLDRGKYELTNTKITLHDDKEVGWIIDGQHRIAGAYKSEVPIVLPIIGLINISTDEQINQFVTINREAKGVPTSLYYDLIKHLPKKTLGDQTKERASDIASILRNNEESPFFGKIVVISSPRKGEISLTTFIKAIAPLVSEGKGLLSAYSLNEQVKIIDNYIRAIRNVFPNYYNDEDSIFFKTTGFGATFKAFPVVFNYCLKNEKGFSVADVSKIFNEIASYDFSYWTKLGTGNAAEIEAADNIRKELESIYTEKDIGDKIRL